MAFNSNVNVFAFCLFNFALASTTMLNAEMSTKQSVDQAMTTYDQAVAHAQNGLHALRGKDLDKGVKHAEMAIKAAHEAENSFGEGVTSETRRDFTEGVKLLEDAVGKRQLSEDVFAMTLAKWDRRVGIRTKGEKGADGAEGAKCHGDGCPLTTGGACASPGSGCDRYNTSKKCTNAYGACYCM